jgi:hypothetical protein
MYDEVRSYLEFQELQQMKDGLTISGVRFCGILEDWIESGHYKRHWDGLHQRWVECQSFRQFMEATPPQGLGLGEKAKEEIQILERGGVKSAGRVLAAWYRDQPLPDQTIGIEGGQAGPGRSNKTADNVSRFSYGNDTSYTLRRLARDAPELLDKIEAGEMNVNQAAIAAGIRKKPSNAEKAVAAFRRSENRLEPLKLMVGLLEPYELAVLRDWCIERLD